MSRSLQSDIFAKLDRLASRPAPGVPGSASVDRTPDPKPKFGRCGGSNDHAKVATSPLGGSAIGERLALARAASVEHEAEDVLPESEPETINPPVAMKRPASSAQASAMKRPATAAAASVDDKKARAEKKKTTGVKSKPVASDDNNQTEKALEDEDEDESLPEPPFDEEESSSPPPRRGPQRRRKNLQPQV